MRRFSAFLMIAALVAVLLPSAALAAKPVPSIGSIDVASLGEVITSQEAATPAAIPAAMTETFDQLWPDQVCAWPVEIALDALNIGYPDTNVSYFVLPYVLSPGESIVVEGTYPFTRFFSILTYYRDLSEQGTGLELLGWLPDYAIAPNPGSTNPAVDTGAPDDSAQRQWTVRITGTASTGTSPQMATPEDRSNVIPAIPADMENVIGVLAMRVYVPEDPADHTGGVGLPTLSLEDGSGDSRALTECTAAERETWESFFLPFWDQLVQEAPRLPLPPSADAQPEWVQTSFPGLGTNPDNRYMMAPIAWEPGRIVVVRGQAPTFPDSRAGESTTTATDVRYWSFCTGENTVWMPTASCAYDFGIPIATDGSYTVVVSQREDRPANATEDDGVAWMQAGGTPTQPDLLFLKHLLPSEAFYDQSVWAVPEGVVGAAEDVMGPYYPQITYCDVATFEEGGADACFDEAE
jgi:hypothetical protein